MRPSKIKVTAIVPSAGKGRRFKSGRKPLAVLCGRPVLSYTLRAIQSSPLIQDIVLVVDKSLIGIAGGLARRYGITKVKHIVEGGRTRTDSVRKGLNFVDGDTRLVLIHDGVRPLVTPGVIKKTVNAALKFGASVAAVPARATIKISSGSSFVKYTPNRKELWEVQTPQVFKKELIAKAYRSKRLNGAFTDDASLIENIGERVKIVKGDYRNIKITTKEDIKIAEVLLKSRE